MKKSVIALSLILLSGCVDMGRVGLHPQVKMVYFDGHPWQLESCLSEAAQNQQLYLAQDDPLPGATKRFNLEQDGETVAWVEIDRFSRNQTSATFYADPKASDVQAAISDMVTACRTSR